MRSSTSRVRPRDAVTAPREAVILAVLLGGSAVLHLRNPAKFDAMLPRILPGPKRFWTIGSALAEFAITAATLVPATRPLGGALGATLLTLVFPANVVDTRTVFRDSHSTRGRKIASVVRLPLQALINAADAAGLWTIQSSIFPENTANLALHDRAGFRRVGTRERIARMTHGPAAGTWRDTILIERRRPD